MVEELPEEEVLEPVVVETPTETVETTTEDDSGFFSNAWSSTKNVAGTAADATVNAAQSTGQAVSNTWNNLGFSFIAEPEEVAPHYTWKSYVEVGVGLVAVGAGTYMLKKGKKHNAITQSLLDDDFSQV